MRYLFILNDAPYGAERLYNGLRLALSLAKRDGVEVRVFLMGDAVGCAVAGQLTPDGYYNVERMLKGLAKKHVPGGLLRHVPEGSGDYRRAARVRRRPLLSPGADGLDALGRARRQFLSVGGKVPAR